MNFVLCPPGNMPSVADPVVTPAHETSGKKNAVEIAERVNQILVKEIDTNELVNLDKQAMVSRSVCRVKNASGIEGNGFFCVLPFKSKKLQIVGIMCSNHVVTSEMLKNPEATLQLEFEKTSPFVLKLGDDVCWRFTDKNLDATFVQLDTEAVKKLLEVHPMKPLEFVMKRISENQEISVVQFVKDNKIQYDKTQVGEIRGFEYKHQFVGCDASTCGSPLVDAESFYIVGVSRRKAIEGNNDEFEFNWAVASAMIVRKVVKKWRRLKATITRKPRDEMRRPRSKNSAVSISENDEIGMAIEESYGARLHKHAQNGNLKGVKEVVKKFQEEFGESHVLRLIDHHNPKNNSRTAVAEAAQEGALKVVKYLVQDCGANLYEHDSSDLRLTAVHLAAENGHFETVQFLLQMEPELLEFGDKFGDSVLAMACFGGQLRIVEFLVEKKKANLENKGELGRTPLMRAVVNGHLPVVKYLVKKGANLEAKDATRHRNTVMHLAAYFNHSGVVSFLSAHKPSLVKAKNGMGRLPIFYAKLPVNKSDVIALLDNKQPEQTA